MHLNSVITYSDKPPHTDDGVRHSVLTSIAPKKPHSKCHEEKGDDQLDKKLRHVERAR